MMYDQHTGSPIIDNVDDKRVAVGLVDALGCKISDTEFKTMWRFLFAFGVVTSLTPPSDWNI
jgi:hypothetical protein